MPYLFNPHGASPHAWELGYEHLELAKDKYFSRPKPNTGTGVPYVEAPFISDGSYFPGMGVTMYWHDWFDKFDSRLRSLEAMVHSLKIYDNQRMGTFPGDVTRWGGGPLRGHKPTAGAKQNVFPMWRRGALCH